ncbi:MAG: MBL fold metallo-hydrolase, partial [Planctomycetes bacterium]|nr:MBL fold metallo-hydrolase [Planctomycetota bacterium]
MKIRQYYLACLSHASYMITDETTKTAVVVDPQRDINQYIADAKAGGYTIRHVFLTHFHADFIAGHIELRDRAGATIHLGRRAQAEFACVLMNDGDTVAFGDVKLEIMETPGHTPEGISILVYDLATSAAAPLAVLTGDTLFIGDVGRPDLLASIGVTADELADMLHDSITRLIRLPDATLVYPAHGAGSMCGKSLSKETVSTIGEQKKFNYALQPMSREEFKKIVTADQPEAPEYFVHDAILNRKERASLDDAMKTTLTSLVLDKLLAMQKAGAQILDVRDGIDFEGGHLKGSINIALSGKYATWAGSMLSTKRPIVVIADEGGEEEAVMRLGRIGLDNVAGYLAGGMSALALRDDLVERTERITAPALAEWLDGSRSDLGARPVVVDVRTGAEYAEGHVAGSVNIPLTHLE